MRTWIIQHQIEKGGEARLNYWGPYCCESSAKASGLYDPDTCLIVKIKKSPK